MSTRNSEPSDEANAFADLIEQSRLHARKSEALEKELHQTLAMLEEARRFNAQVLDSVNAGIVVYDRHLVCVARNRFMESLSGIPSREVIGYDILSQFPDLKKYGIGAALEGALAGKIMYLDHPVARIYGTTEMLPPGADVAPGDTRRIIWTEPVYLPLLNAEGQVEGVLLIVHDITERKRIEDEIRLTTDSLARAQMIANIGNWDWDIVLNTLHWSDQIYRIFGLQPREFGATYEAFLRAVHPEDRQAVMDAVNASLASGIPYSIDHRIVRRDGTVRIVHEQADVLRTSTGRPLRMIGTVQDVTEWRRAETALKESHERFELAVRGSNDGIWDWNLVTDDVYFSDRWCALVGREPDQMTPHISAWRQMLHEEDRERVLHELERHLFDRMPFDCEYRMRTPSGDLRWFRARGQALWNADGQAVRMSGSLTDITESKRSALNLRLAHDQLHHLSTRLLDVQERERRHIAHELHDEIGQALTAVKLSLNNLMHEVSKEQIPLVQSATEITQGAINEVRQLSRMLRPPQLDLVGLNAALEALVEQHRAAGVMVEYCGSEGLPKLSKDVEIACYRLVQEALTNVLRHAKANKVQVQLLLHDDILAVSVADDGTGFDVESVRSLALTGHSLGLLGMEERAARAKGNVQIRSRIGQGTEVTARFALQSSIPT